MNQQKAGEAPTSTLGLDEIAFNEELKAKKPLNIQAITVSGNNDIFVIEPNRHTYIQSRLLIDIKTGRPKEIGFNDTFANPFDFKKSYSAFLGITSIYDRLFLVLVDEVEQVCILENCGIFTITSVSFVPVQQDDEFFSSDKGKELIGLVLNLRKLLTQGFYFSYTYDLTISKYKRANNFPTDNRFMWNYHLCKEMNNFGVSVQWQLPLIQGYVGRFMVPVQKKPVECFLISRRSWIRGGTRPNVRGLDDNGNVANHVETEQILCFNNYSCSHIQLRGNPPVFFMEQAATISTQVKMTRSVEFTNQPFIEHLKYLDNDWSYVLCVNLLTMTKREEQLMTEVYEDLMRNNNFKRIRYEYFDYVNTTKTGKMDKVNIFIQKLRPVIENMAFYVEDLTNRQVKLAQRGVIRTSCIDGLDRTNYIQAKLGIAIFNVQLKNLGIELLTEFTQDPVIQFDVEDPKQNHPLLVAFKDLWALNGEALSLQYAGALPAQNFGSKNKQKSWLDMLDYSGGGKSVGNLGNLDEPQRHDAVSLLTDNHPANTSQLQTTIQGALKQSQAEFTTYHNLNIFIGTWNVGTFVPSKDFDMTTIFNFEGQNAPDILAIGLQEYIELTASNVVVGSGTAADLVWRDCILQNICQFHDYILLCKETLVGLLSLVFVKRELKERISNINGDIVKTGLAGTLGNKGGIAIRFNVDETSLCFINSHLEAGNKQNNVRLSNVSDIHQKAFHQGPALSTKQEEQVLNLDYTFFYGDLNFRLTCENEDVRGIIDRYLGFLAEGNTKEAEHMFGWLLGEDELVQARDSHEYLGSYKEGTVTFLPTYKYDVNSEVYDTSAKKRPPAWTDRILYQNKNGEIYQAFYNRREDKNSDHRPVVSYFTIQTKITDFERKNAIIQSFYQ